MSWLKPLSKDNPPKYKIRQNKCIEILSNESYKEKLLWIEAVLPIAIKANFPATWKMIEETAREFWDELEVWENNNLTDLWFSYHWTTGKNSVTYMYHFKSERDAMLFKLRWA